MQLSNKLVQQITTSINKLESDKKNAVRSLDFICRWKSYKYCFNCYTTKKEYDCWVSKCTECGINICNKCDIYIKVNCQICYNCVCNKCEIIKLNYYNCSRIGCRGNICEYCWKYNQYC